MDLRALAIGFLMNQSSKLRINDFDRAWIQHPLHFLGCCSGNEPQRARGRSPSHGFLSLAFDYVQLHGRVEGRNSHSSHTHTPFACLGIDPKSGGQPICVVEVGHQLRKVDYLVIGQCNLAE